MTSAFCMLLRACFACLSHLIIGPGAQRTFLSFLIGFPEWEVIVEDKRKTNSFGPIIMQTAALSREGRNWFLSVQSNGDKSSKEAFQAPRFEMYF
ncbi:hypothetical protein CEXT_303441 [Caerostris extrusa]|uniref:Secreted protein n=1 Tax=Caerostris extrusa TaxID=172846 RepID=A0AAV4SLX8_CAEEX|nr:hypothetical protein CEXT_303441 [Caerostris extrusa]